MARNERGDLVTTAQGCGCLKCRGTGLVDLLVARPRSAGKTSGLAL
jgi:hypothetical protein